VVGGMSRRGGGGAEDVVQGGPVLGRQAVVEFRFEDSDPLADGVRGGTVPEGEQQPLQDAAPHRPLVVPQML